MYMHAIMNARPVLLVASLTAFAGYCLVFFKFSVVTVSVCYCFLL